MLVSLLATSIATEFRPLACTFLAGVPYVLADVAPTTQAWFVLDTGYPDTAYHGTLPEGWSGPRLRVGDDRISVPYQADEGYAIRPGFTNATKIVGSLGCTFLKKGQVLIDADSRTVSLRMGGALTPQKAEAALRSGVKSPEGRLVALPLREDTNGLFYAVGRVDLHRVDWAFDTGSNQLFVESSALVGVPKLDVQRRFAITTAGTTPEATSLVPSVEVGPVRIAVPTLCEDESLSILGVSVLASRVLVDLPGRAAYWLASSAPTAEADAAIGRLIRRPIRTAKDGRLLTDLGRSTIRTVEIVSAGGQSVSALREIFAKAADGDSTALARVVELERAFLGSFAIEVREGDRTYKVE